MARCAFAIPPQVAARQILLTYSPTAQRSCPTGSKTRSSEAAWDQRLERRQGTS